MSGPRTDSNGRIQRSEPETQGAGLAVQLNSPKFREALAAAMPKHVDPGRMLRIVLTAMRTTPTLANTSPESFFGSVLQAAQLGLEVNTPMQHAWLIPRGGQCTLQIGYQGQIELSMRSGRVAGITAQVVRKGDFFEYEFGLSPRLVHRPSDAEDRESKAITHVYAVGRVRDADPVFEVLSIAQVELRRKRSAASGNGPWKTDYEAMVRKTAVRALWKWLPKSSEMARAEALETATDQNRDQRAYLDLQVVEGLEKMGLQPILPTDGEVIDEHGEVHLEPGSGDAP